MKASIQKGWNLIGLNFQGDIGPITTYTDARGHRVWFLKTRPDTPPTWMQIHQMNLFAYVSWAWDALSTPQQADWEAVTKKLSLRLTGYSLFTYLYATDDAATIATLERQAGITLSRNLPCP
jgi:hypothetical protein